MTISEDERFSLFYMSGNRDEEKRDDPFTFNVTREVSEQYQIRTGQS